MPNHKQERSQEKIRRVLVLIDLLAAQHLPKTIAQLSDLTRTHSRTVRRDLDLLHSMNLVDLIEQTDHATGNIVYAYRLDLKRSERLQAAAMLLDE